MQYLQKQILAKCVSLVCQHNIIYHLWNTGFVSECNMGIYISYLTITVTLEAHIVLIVQMKKLKFKGIQGQLISSQSS